MIKNDVNKGIEIQVVKDAGSSIQHFDVYIIYHLISFWFNSFFLV